MEKEQLCMDFCIQTELRGLLQLLTKISFRKRNQTVQIRKSLDFLIEAIVDFGTLISLVMGPD